MSSTYSTLVKPPYFGRIDHYKIILQGFKITGHSHSGTGGMQQVVACDIACFRHAAAAFRIESIL